MRIGLLTEGGYPYVSGDARLWCDRLVRGLAQHEFDVYALSRSEHQEDEGWTPLSPNVRRVRTAPLWTAGDDGAILGRRARRRFTEHFGELAAVLCGASGSVPVAGGASTSGDNSQAGGAPTPEADRFGNALYGLAELAREGEGWPGSPLRGCRTHAGTRLSCARRPPRRA